MTEHDWAIFPRTYMDPNIEPGDPLWLELLRWAWAPFVAIVIGFVRKVLLLDAEVKTLKVQSAAETEMLAAEIKHAKESRAHIINALDSHNNGVTERLNSIEAHLRNNNNSH